MILISNAGKNGKDRCRIPADVGAGVCRCSRIVAGMTACRPAEPKRTRKLIGVSLLTQTHAFYKDLEQAMRQEAAAKSFDLTVAACEMDPVKQASRVEDFVAQKIDALLLSVV